MQFQLSVFYQGSLFSYRISSEDRVHFRFELASAPAHSAPVPQHFSVVHPAKHRWTFEGEADEDFQSAVVKTIKKTKL